jgi:integrase
MQRDQQAALDLAVEIIGDPPVDEIGRPMISDFVAKLQRLPRNRAKDARYRGKPIKRVLQLVEKDPGVPRLSPTTVNKHAGAVSAFFEWAVRQGYVDANPAKGVYKKPKAKKRRQDERAAWTDEQLRVLFTSPIWQGSHHHFRMQPGDHVIRDNKYWLPILGTFHPLRLEEAAQLRIADIKHQDDVWFLSINAENDGAPGPQKKLKTLASWRRIPLHREVLRLGFVEWVEEQRRKGEVLCFSDLKPYGSGERYGWGFSKDFGRLVRKLELKGCTFHGLRHTSITALVRGEVYHDVIDKLDGHEIKGERGRYTKDLPLAQLKEAIDKIAYEGVDADLIAGKRGSRRRR